ncbi:hypothetical protein [Sphingomonas qomolangmaensis]|uniref:Lipoprotein n=1 Tax=Sphingomonas qomolangmaensis TaxID=2918765 RepID=A0ABY5L955_9SPHN|nr:hypothetical protein [Sphingomonas qomolangmaensis]UUL82324.1 hypothetical protein NMP03_14240 [Sphingomonas qomolangmaensis]
MRTALIITSAITLSGCATANGYVSVGASNRASEGTFLQPVVAASTVIEDSTGINTVYWASLTEQQRRNIYNGATMTVQVERQDASGGFTVLPGVVAVSRGQYRLRYRYQLYRETFCQPTNPGAGSVRVGVGVDIRIALSSKQGSLSVGSLVPLVGAVAAKKATGSLSINLIGAGSTSSLMQSYLTGGSELTLDSVTKAMESLKVMQAVLDDKTQPTNPSYLEVFEKSPGSCNSTPNLPAAVSKTAST